MLRLATAFALLALAAPALAQPSSSPEAPNEIDAAAEAFASCIGINAERADADASPEVAAAAVFATCAPHRRRLENLAEMMIAGLPLERRRAASEQLRTNLDGSEARIAEGIRRQRGGAAAPASPAN